MSDVPDPIADLDAKVSELSRELRNLRASISGPAADICKIIEAIGDAGRIEIRSPQITSSSTYSNSAGAGWVVIVNGEPIGEPS